MNRDARSSDREEQSAGPIQELAVRTEHSSQPRFEGPRIGGLHLRAPDRIRIADDSSAFLLEVGQNLAERFLLLFPLKSGRPDLAGHECITRKPKFPDEPDRIREGFVIDLKLHVFGIA